MPVIPAAAAQPNRAQDVLRAEALDPELIAGWLRRLGLRASRLPPGVPIPGSYWGDEEAGLERDVILYRADTPLHSILHEACHYACMTPQRRSSLDTDAGGDDLEECAVCYLQVLLADSLPVFGAARMLEDMDAWGYSFRLGSARRWFLEDAADARAWLQEHGLIDSQEHPTWCLRGGRRAEDT